MTRERGITPPDENRQPISSEDKETHRMLYIILRERFAALAETIEQLPPSFPNKERMRELMRQLRNL